MEECEIVYVISFVWVKMAPKLISLWEQLLKISADSTENVLEATQNERLLHPVTVGMG